MIGKVNSLTELEITRRNFIKLGSVFAGSILFMGLPHFLAGCSDLEGDLHEVTDMAGRKVVVPGNIDHVYCSNSVGAINIYFLDPEVLIGWNRPPARHEGMLIPESDLHKPLYGSWWEDDSGPDVGGIMSEDPQLIVCADEVDENGIRRCDEIRNQTGIPSFLLDFNVKNIAYAYRTIGALLDLDERAESLAQYCLRKVDQIEELANRIPSDKRKKVYIARGLDGLTITPVNHHLIISALDLIGVTDVVSNYNENAVDSTIRLSINEIQQLSPDAIFVEDHRSIDGAHSELFDHITRNSSWMTVPCIQSGHVYRLPHNPFSWFSEPPSAMMYLGLFLMLTLLYPDYSESINMAKETKMFYSLFVHYELSDEEVKSLLASVGVDRESLF